MVPTLNASSKGRGHRKTQARFTCSHRRSPVSLPGRDGFRQFGEALRHRQMRVSGLWIHGFPRSIALLPRSSAKVHGIGLHPHARETFSTLLPWRNDGRIKPLHRRSSEAFLTWFSVADSGGRIRACECPYQKPARASDPSYFWRGTTRLSTLGFQVLASIVLTGCLQVPKRFRASTLRTR